MRQMVHVVAESDRDESRAHRADDGRLAVAVKIHEHDLRHRRITLWHGQGIPAREIGERVGQRQISTTLDVYTHVMPLDEISVGCYLRLLRGSH